MNEAETSPERSISSDDRMDPAMVEVYRSKTPTERLQIAFAMWRSARKIVTAAVKHQHPESSEEERQREVARRLSRGFL